MSRQSRLDGKVVIVTGASTGLGRTIALKLADEGAKLVVCASRTEKHTGEEEATHDIICKKHGPGKAIFTKTDMSEPEDIEACVQEAVTKGGKLDVLVNNAGVLTFGRCHETTVEAFDQVLDVNMRGTFLSCKYAITQFMKQEQNSVGVRGNIINIGSFASHVGGPISIAYCTSKGAMLNMTKSIAIDYANDGIQANIVCPGYARTEMTKDFFATDWIVDRMKFLTPWWNAIDNCADGVANTVAFIASNESMYMTGAAINVDGGVTAQ